MTSPLTRVGRHSGNRLLHMVGNALVALLLTALVAAFVVLFVLPRTNQGAALTVLTGSMSPEIPVGSVVLVRPVDPGTIEIGDIATYQAEPGKEVFVTHRVHEIDRSTNPRSFTFKGDANDVADSDPVPAGAIRGEVWFHVPYLGAVRDGIYGKGGITAVAMILLGAYAVSQFAGGVGDRRRKRPCPPIDRPLVLVQLLRDRLDHHLGLDVEQAAHRWQAAVVAEDANSATFLLAPSPEGFVATLELLGGLEPVAIEAFERPLQVVGEKPTGRVAELLDAAEAARPTSTGSEVDRATH